MRNFFGWFFGALYSVYAVRELQIPPAVLGVLIGIGGIGALIGAFVAQPAAHRFGVGSTLIAAMVIHGALHLALPFAAGPLIAVALLLGAVQILGDIALEVFFIQELSLRQSVVPSRVLGRANASVQFLIVGVGPLGALVAGALGDTVGLRWTMLIAALGCLLSAGRCTSLPCGPCASYPLMS